MITGWINSKGVVIETKPYQHLKDVDEVLSNIWKPLQEEIDEAYRCSEELSEAGEHPEWHRYEIAESDCQARAYDEAYALGYLRISPYLRTSEQPMIAVEGLQKWIETHKYVLKELADKHGCRIKTYIHEPIKNRW